MKNKVENYAASGAFVLSVLMLLSCRLPLAADVPAPWKFVEVGQVVKGKANANPAGDQFALTGQEAKIWDVADKVPYVYAEPEGDFELVVKLGDLKPAGTKSLGGVQIRFLNSDGVPKPDDAQTYLGRRGNDQMLQMLRRSFRGGQTLHRDLGLHEKDVWLRVVRVGRVISLWFSTDGIAWNAPRYSALGSEGRVAVGLVGGATDKVVAEQAFDEVSLGPIRASYQTTWLGNSLPGGGSSVGHVQNFVRAIWVDPEKGDFFLNGEDENSSFNAWRADGSFLWTRQEANFQHGSAVAADADWVYQALHRARGQKDGFVRIQRATGRLEGGPYLQNHLILGMAVYQGSLVIADATENRICFWDLKEMKEIRSVEFDRPGPLAVDSRNGDLWVIRMGEKEKGVEVIKLSGDGQPAGVELKGMEWPRGVAVGPEGKVYVTDSGRAQQVVLFDEKGKELSRFGAEGGVWSRFDNTQPGENHPLKLNFPNAVAVDNTGNMTVVNSGPKQYWGIFQGGSLSNVRKFNAKGELLWELHSTIYVDCGDFVPGSDGQMVASRDSLYQLDYSKPPGQGWRHIAFTVDPFKYPQDPRLTTNRIGGTWQRVIGGKPFLITADMVNETLNFFRTQEDSKILVPAARFNRGADNRPQDFYLWRDANGDGAIQEEEKQNGTYERHLWGLWVDTRGDIWTATKAGPIRRYPFQGLDEHGNPIYDLLKAESWPRPAELFPEGQAGVDMERVCYLPESDTLYVSGYTGKLPKDKDAREWGTFGTELICYENWTKLPRLKWRIELPYSPNRGGHHSPVIKSAAFAGDYVFLIRSTDAMVYVHHKDDGKLVTTLRPGPEVGGHCGLIDIMQGMNAIKRADGEYVVILEDDDNAKNILIRWKP